VLGLFMHIMRLWWINIDKIVSWSVNITTR
jgi:hypothetical protein